LRAKLSLALAIFLILAFGLPDRSCCQFGKNKVQYSRKRWHYIRSEHFDVYFYEGGEKLASFAADVAESTYVRLRRDFRYDLRERVPIIVYNSHNDFEQTNVTWEIPEEAVGGFTEFLKNRVVVPFQGSYKDFRHVVAHELTHAVSLQMMYGTGVGSIVYGVARFSPPMWFTEGLPEYESLGWDTEADMWMRDAVLNGYLPPIEALGGYFAYKGGQSVLYYISQRYGRESIGEILRKMKNTRDTDSAFMASIGMSPSELTPKWHEYLKKRYWPEIARRKKPEDFARRLTSHEDLGNMINISPALSPSGDRMAFLSNRKGYFEIYLVSSFDNTITRKLVEGETRESLEEMHWLRPGMGWSPDGKRIVFAAKGGARDVIHILDVEKAEITDTYSFDLDGIFSPSWSPDGRRIAFEGVSDGQSDIYVFNIKSGKLVKVTDDVFSDLSPSWSPDGRRIAFASDRGSFPDSLAAGEVRMQDPPKLQYDIYVINSDGSGLRRLTSGDADERTPVWSPDGGRIAFTSDRNGIFNIYIYSLEDNTIYPITDTITGCDHLSWALRSDRIAFSSLYNGGYDIYLLENPSGIKPGSLELADTAYMRELKSSSKARAFPEAAPERSIPNRGDFSSYIFYEDYLNERLSSFRKLPPEKLPIKPEARKLPDGSYQIFDYRVKFSPDIVNAYVGYDPFYGLLSNTFIGLSDMLGDHQFLLGANLIYDLKNSDYAFSYFYLPRRTDYSISAFHTADFFWMEGGIARLRNYGLIFGASYPFSKFRRVDFDLYLLRLVREFVRPEESYTITAPGLSFVSDTVVWGRLGPVNGLGLSLSALCSPRITGSGLDFQLYTVDLRKYFMLKPGYSFALRLAGGASGGRNAVRFFLGGIDSWINPGFRNLSEEFSVADVYFATMLTPLRGTSYYEREGTRAFLTNFEFRFPFIRNFSLSWPLPLSLSNVGGTIFADLGGAWSDDRSFKPFAEDRYGRLFMRDLLFGTGLGMRINLGFTILRIDIAWTSNLAGWSHPRYNFSLGPNF